MDLVAQNVNYGFADLMLGDILLELPVVGEDVEDGEDGDAEIDAFLVVFGEGSAEDGEEGLYIRGWIP